VLSTGAGGAAPGARAGSGPRVTPPPEPMVISDPAGQAVPPSASEPAREDPVRSASVDAREEPARSVSTDARALVKAKGPAVEPQGSSQPLVSYTWLGPPRWRMLSPPPTPAWAPWAPWRRSSVTLTATR
jgi:hypothetical protein